MKHREPRCKIEQRSTKEEEIVAREHSFDDAVPSYSFEEAVKMARLCFATTDCVYCDVCTLMCPDLAITRDGTGKIKIDLAYCKGCGLCAHYCPKGAITMVVDNS